MGRIRSIKPQFWTDGSNLELSDSCALFFIGLWNFCDDEGKHPLDLNQLVAELGGRWHVGKVKLFLSCLIKSGQLCLNSDSTWIQVTGWSHQRIDKPRQPDVKSEELSWLNHDESKKALENSRLFGARIGKDRIREDRIGKGEANSDSSNPPTFTSSRKPKASAPDGTHSVIARYCELWKAKYGAAPPVGGKVAGQIKTLVSDHGPYKAIEFIEAYLEMPDSWFVTKRHDVATLMANLNAVAQFIETGRMFTKKEIHNLDSSNSLRNTLDAIDRGEI